MTYWVNTVGGPTVFRVLVEVRLDLGQSHVQSGRVTSSTPAAHVLSVQPERNPGSGSSARDLGPDLKVFGIRAELGN